MKIYVQTHDWETYMMQPLLYCTFMREHSSRSHSIFSPAYFYSKPHVMEQRPTSDHSPLQGRDALYPALTLFPFPTLLTTLPCSLVGPDQIDLVCGHKSKRSGSQGGTLSKTTPQEVHAGILKSSHFSRNTCRVGKLTNLLIHDRDFEQNGFIYR